MLSLQSPSQLTSILGLDFEKVKALVKDKIIPIVEHSQNAARTLVVAELSDIVKDNIKKYPAEKIVTEAKPKSFYNIRVFMDHARDKHQLAVTLEDMKALASSSYAALEDVIIYDRTNRYLVIPDEQAAVDFLEEREFDRDEGLAIALTHINLVINPLISKRMFIKLLTREYLDRTKIAKDTAYRKDIIYDLTKVGNILIDDPSTGKKKIVLYSRKSAREALLEHHKGEHTGAAKIINDFFDKAVNKWYFLPEDLENIATKLFEGAQKLDDLDTAIAEKDKAVEGGIRRAILEEEFLEDETYNLEKIAARLVKAGILMRVGSNQLSRPGPALTAELEYNPCIQLTSKGSQQALVKKKEQLGFSYQLMGSWFFHYKEYLLKHNQSLPDRDYQIQVQTLSELMKYIIIKAKFAKNYEEAIKALLSGDDLAIDHNYLDALLGMKRRFIKEVQDQTMAPDEGHFKFQFIRNMKISPEEKKIEKFSLNKTLQALKKENPKFDLAGILNKIARVLSAFGPIPDYLVYEQVAGERCEYIKPLPEATKTELYAAIVIDGTNMIRVLKNVTGAIAPDYLRKHSSRMIESQVDETRRIYYSINLEDSKKNKRNTGYKKTKKIKNKQ